jgi:hypothetical protein
MAAEDRELMPYRTVTIETPLAMDEALASLATLIQPKRGLWSTLRSGLGASNGRTEPFEGTIGRRRFKIMRVIGYRNSFLPVIVGSVEPTASGCRVRLVMRLHAFVATFMLLWMAMPVFVTLRALAEGHGSVWPAAIFPILGSAVVLIGFLPESSKAARLIRECLGPARAERANRRSTAP